MNTSIESLRARLRFAALGGLLVVGSGAAMARQPHHPAPGTGSGASTSAPIERNS